MIGLEENLIELKEKMSKVEAELTSQIKKMREKSKSYLETDQKIEIMIYENKNFIKLNIGGKSYIVKLATLGTIKDTLFYMLIFNYLKDGKTLPEELFIDRSPTWFDLILEYLRSGALSLKGYTKKEKQEILADLEYYGIELFKKGKEQIDIEWDQALSKVGACTIDITDKRLLQVHSTTCYTHFVMNKQFTTENFVIEIDSTVTQTNNYYYFGLINEGYSMTGNCMCCNPANSWYIRCDGAIITNSSSRSEPSLAWYASPVVLGMKVHLSSKEIYFYKDTPDNEKGPFQISSGSSYRVVCGHCNSGSGSITIAACYYI